MRLLPLAVLAVLFTAPATAQINTERLRADVEPGAHLQLDLGGGFATGNTDFLQLNLGGRLDLVRERDNAFLVSNYTFSEVDGVTDVSRAFAHIRYNRPIVPRLIAEAFAQIERNEQTRLERRYLAGGGLRYEILDREAIGLALGATPMFEYERLAPAAMEDVSEAIRLSNYLSVRLEISETAEAFGVVYFQPRANDFDDWRLLHESRLDLQMTEHFKVRLRATTRHDSQPPIGVEATDVMLTTGLVYTSWGS
ncbi:MAG: DUF481 domain-containing protein [Bacteroidota bacterium]